MVRLRGASCEVVYADTAHPWYTAAIQLNHAERLAYLHAEAQCLLEHHQELREEFTALINAPFDREVWTAYRHKLHFYCGLLENHVLALKWLTNPPHKTTDCPRSTA
jgi:hypothetical protein